MKTTNLLLIISILLAVVVGAVAVTMVGLSGDNRGLRREIQTARADLQRATDQITRLENEKAEVAAELANKGDALQKTETELARAGQASSNTNEVVVSSGMPRPVKLRTYLGNQYLGMSWLVPTGISKDPRSGAVTYEPVLVLDETIKQNLVTYRTNIVEREVSRSTTVNYNYPWTYYYPLVFAVGTNKAANCSVGQTPNALPPKQPQTQNSKPFLSTTIQPPTAKPFLPVITPGPSLPPQNRLTRSGGLRLQTGGTLDTRKQSLAAWVFPGS